MLRIYIFFLLAFSILGSNSAFSQNALDLQGQIEAARIDLSNKERELSEAYASGVGSNIESAMRLYNASENLYNSLVNTPNPPADTTNSSNSNADFLTATASSTFGSTNYTELLDGKLVVREIEEGIAALIVSNLYMQLTKIITKVIYDDLATLVKPLFSVFASLWLISKVLQIISNAPVTLTQLTKGLFVIFIGYSFTNQGGYLFVNWFYNPLVNTFFDFSGWMLQKTSHDTDLSEALLVLDSGGNKLTYAITVIEARVRDVFTFAGIVYDYYSETGSMIVGALKGGVLALGLLFIFFFLLLYFTFLIAYSLFAMHVYFAWTPLAIIFFVFPVSRGVSKQWLKGILNYLTLPLVAATAMGITSFILSGAMQDMQGLLKAGTEAQEALENGFPIELYLTLLFTGFISFFVHIRASEMASHLTGGTTSGVGSDFMRMVSMGSNLTTAAATSVLAAPAAVKMAGLKTANTVGAISEGVKSGASSVSERLSNPERRVE
jgi:type IV secretory pathway VirB6-like protein